MQSADEVSKDEQSSPQIESSEPEPKLKPDADVEVVIVADLEEEEGIKSDIRSDRVEDSVPSQQTVEQTVLPELKKDEGNRTFTMRELITELKEGDFVDGELRPSGNSEAITPYSQNSGQAHYSEQYDIAMDLINSVKGVDEEGRSRQHILTFAAKRYASAIGRNPDDYDALYN